MLPNVRLRIHAGRRQERIRTPRGSIATIGQATTEYILLICLVILLLVLLYDFRDAVTRYASTVADWSGHQSTSASAHPVTTTPVRPQKPSPPKPPPPPPPKPPKPPVQPKPTPPPMTPVDWSSWLRGRWCPPSGHVWTGVQTRPGVVNGYPVTSLGTNKFRFTNPSNPNDYTDYERLPNGSFRMVYRNLTPNMPASAPWVRCPAAAAGA